MTIAEHDHTPDRAGALFNSRAAISLLLGTAAVESDMGTYIRQVGGGPALGIFQMEPATHDDIWVNYIDHRSSLHTLMLAELPTCTSISRHELLEHNLRYAILMARLHYFRLVVPIPESVEEQAEYWKKHYNTPLGKGSASKYIAKVNSRVINA